MPKASIYAREWYKTSAIAFRAVYLDEAYLFDAQRFRGPSRGHQNSIGNRAGACQPHQPSNRKASTPLMYVFVRFLGAFSVGHQRFPSQSNLQCELLIQLLGSGYSVDLWYTSALGKCWECFRQPLFHSQRPPTPPQQLPALAGSTGRGASPARVVLSLMDQK